jgi:hypothetical protein
MHREDAKNANWQSGPAALGAGLNPASVRPTGLPGKSVSQNDEPAARWAQCVKPAQAIE